jgi:O-antigen/teichoic acid export membrane protein
MLPKVNALPLRGTRLRDLGRRLLRADFFQHGALIFASTTLVNLCNYAFHLLISRKLGVTGYGALASLLAGLMLATIPATIASSTVAKYASALHAVRDTGRLRTLAERVFLFSGLIAGGVCILGFAARNPLAWYLNLPDSRPVLSLTLIVSVQFMFLAIRGILQGVQDFSRFAIATASEVCGKLVLGVTLVYAGFGFAGAMLGYAIASALSLLYTIIAVHAHINTPRAPLLIGVGRMLRTTGGIAVSTASLSSLGFADVVLVKHFFDPHVAGLYGVISLVGKTLLFFVNFVPTIVLPKASARAARGESALPLLAQASVAMICAAVVGLGWIYLFPSLTIAMMAGPAFTAAAPYVFPYGCAMALLAASTIVASYKIGLHQFNFLLPFVVAAVGELIALQFVHKSLSDVIAVILVGHTIAFLGSLFRITAVQRYPERILEGNELAVVCTE